MTTTLSPETLRAEAIRTATEVAMGRGTIADDAAPIRIRGAQNNYNARGSGSTMARRVLRDGEWKWVSAPASRARLRSGDRHDTQMGDVWVGEIVANYTLGARGTPTPDSFVLVIGGDDKPLQTVPHVKRRDGQYTLTFGEETLVVSSPAWR